VRLRTELDDRGLGAVDETVLIHLLRTRLRATARPLPWITVVAEVQDARYLGSGDPSQGRGTTDISPDGLDMHQAWAQIDHPFDLPVDLRFGRQEISFANERLIGVSNWSNTGRAFDGARAMIHGDEVSVDLFAARLSAPVPGPTASQNLYGAWGNWKPAADMSVDLFALRDDNTTPVRRGEDSGKSVLGRNTVGTLLRGTFGPVNVELEGAGQFGENAANDSAQRRTIQAFLGSATITATILPESKTSLFVLGTVLSGDGSASDDRNETFNTLFGTNHKFYGTIDYVPDLSGNFGLVDLGAGISSAPVKGLRIVLDGHVFMPQRSSQEQFGSEVDLTATWRLAAPFELSGGAALFMPGELLKARIGDSARSWAFLAGSWEF